MKRKIIFCLILFLGNNYLYAQFQNDHLYKVPSKSLISVLCNIDSVFSKNNDNLLVKVFLISNGYGSAKLPETDEVSFRLLIAVSTIDDTPDQNLYEIRSLIYPKILSFKESSLHEFILVLEYGASDRKKKNIKITENNCVETN